MKILIVKISSMGDVLHTLPAITDAAKAYTNCRFDWVVEEGFVEIAAWHSHVDRIIPIAMRKWKKNIWQCLCSGALKKFIKQLRAEKYDYIIDAQGLTKSALIARLAKGPVYGLSSKSARDPIAFLHYKKHFSISWEQHAVSRIRELFANTLDYAKPTTLPEYGIATEKFSASPFPEKYLVFLHGTTWTTKFWPEKYWRSLVEIATQAGFHVYLNSGNPDELARATRVTDGIKNATAMPRKSINTLAVILEGAQGVVAVDTGLGHLTAALAKPAVSIYGATSAKMTGAFGINQTHLQSTLSCSPCLAKSCDKPPQLDVTPPCYAELDPQLVWKKLMAQMESTQGAACA